MSVIDGSNMLNFAYDLNGNRIAKNNIRYYYSADGLLVSEAHSGYDINYIYGANGSLLGFKYRGQTYYYHYSPMGDVMAIYTSPTNVVARYHYGPWGELLYIANGSNANVSSDPTHIANINPIRYRGYYYDTETGFYYVSSRYYDPEIKRWISPEPNVDYGEFDEGAGLIGYNVYAYCANNPIKYKDETGESITLACVLIGAGIGLVAGGAFGAYRADKNGYSPSDGWKYWKYVVGYGAVGGAIGALIGWGAGALIAKYGVTTAATSITKGGGARFSSFNALKRSLGSAGRGKQWHHIVEQCQIGKSGFSKYWIQNSNNVINISNSVHSKVSAYYNSVHRFTNGMRFRDWLSGQSFKTQYEWGIKVLRMYGVKI